MKREVAPTAEPKEVERIFREVYGQAVAALVRVFGDITLAEDAVQDAFVVANDRWRGDGIPPNPAGWIVTTARNRAIDVHGGVRRYPGTFRRTAAVFDVLDVVTQAIARAPAGDRRNPDYRTLRQGLGYCWSVAVAADPAAGPGRMER